MTSNPQSSKSAWVQLYEARQPAAEARVRPVGRPPSMIPRRKVGLTLSQAEINDLELWQERLSQLLNRKVSTGETAGILARICTTRMARLFGSATPATLAELVDKMVGPE
jgi:hypothetical protein